MLFYLFLITDLYLKILAVIAQIAFIMNHFNPTSELVIPIGIPTEEAKADIEIHLTTMEAKTENSSIQFKVIQTFLCFLIINSICYISSMK